MDVRGDLDVTGLHVPGVTWGQSFRVTPCPEGNLTFYLRVDKTLLDERFILQLTSRFALIPMRARESVMKTTLGPTRVKK